MENKKNGLIKSAIESIVMAEKKFDYVKNTEKFNYVYNAIYTLIPKYLKIFIIRDRVIKFIEKIFSEIKVALNHKDS